MNFVDKLGVFVKKYLSLLVLIGAAISYINPNIFIGVVPYFNYILGFIMFGMGMTLTKDDFILVPFPAASIIALKFIISLHSYKYFL